MLYRAKRLDMGDALLVLSVCLQVVFRVGIALLASAQDQLCHMPFERLVAALNGRKFPILNKQPDSLIKVRVGSAANSACACPPAVALRLSAMAWQVQPVKMHPCWLGSLWALYRDTCSVR